MKKCDWRLCAPIALPYLAEDMMWQAMYDFLIGLAILPIGLMLAGGGGAGLWYILTRAPSKIDYLVMLIGPVQTAAGIFLVYKSYDYILRMFGVHLTDWL